jgi:hypothetical protein
VLGAGHDCANRLLRPGCCRPVMCPRAGSGCPSPAALELTDLHTGCREKGSAHGESFGERGRSVGDVGAVSSRYRMARLTRRGLARRGRISRRRAGRAMERIVREAHGGSREALRGLVRIAVSDAPTAAGARQTLEDWCEDPAFQARLADQWGSWDYAYRKRRYIMEWGLDDSADPFVLSLLGKPAPPTEHSPHIRLVWLLDADPSREPPGAAQTLRNAQRNIPDRIFHMLRGQDLPDGLEKMLRSTDHPALLHALYTAQTSRFGRSPTLARLVQETPTTRRCATTRH